MTQATKFIRCLMSDGKRRRGERIFDAAMEVIRQRIHGTATVGEILNGVIESFRPGISIQSRRAGGVQYEVPVPVPEKRGRAISIRTIIKSARYLPGRGMAGRLAKVMLEGLR